MASGDQWPTTFIKLEISFLYFQEYNIDPNCQCIEDLMKQCWNTSADKRPSAEDIISDLYMRSEKFMAFKKMYNLPCGLKDKSVDCISFTNDVGILIHLIFFYK